MIIIVGCWPFVMNKCMETGLFNMKTICRPILVPLSMMIRRNCGRVWYESLDDDDDLKILSHFRFRLLVFFNELQVIRALSRSLWNFVLFAFVQCSLAGRFCPYLNIGDLFKSLVGP